MAAIRARHGRPGGNPIRQFRSGGIRLGADLYGLRSRTPGPPLRPMSASPLRLPTGVPLVSATPSQGDCQTGAGTVTCDLGSIARSEQAFLDVVITAPSESTTITNTAVVTSSLDPNSSNNSSTEDTDIRPPCHPAVCIDNDTVLLAVNPEGHLMRRTVLVPRLTRVRRPHFLRPATTRRRLGVCARAGVPQMREPTLQGTRTSPPTAVVSTTWCLRAFHLPPRPPSLPSTSRRRCE